MSNDDLINIGFVKIKHFTIGDNVIYDLDRNRQLSASAVGTCNEMLFISQLDYIDNTKITDVVILHNYDYDGFLTIEKVKNIINSITNKNI